MIFPLRTLFLAAAMLPLSVHAADTYVLKNGDRVKGDLVRETADSYVVEVHLAPTIRDERVIPKDTVIRIVKPEAGLAEFEQLRNLIPTPDGLAVGDYRQRIELMTQFIENFPANQHVRKAMEIRDELRDEMRLVEDGASKIDGVMYPAKELRENAYELDARIAARKVKDLIADRQHLKALRQYSQFQEEYSYTKVHLEMIPLMQKLISFHASQAAEWRQTLEIRKEEREKGFATMTPADRRASQRAIEEEEAKLRMLYRTETATGVGWVTTHKFSKESLDYTANYARVQLKKLDDLMSKEFIDCGAMYRDMFKLSQQGAEPKSMRDMIRKSEKYGMPKRYTEKFALADG